MRLITSISLFAMTFQLFSFAGLPGEKRIEPRNYNIVSDEKDENIDEGKYRIKGEVRMFSSNLPLENVLIGSTESGTWMRTDSAGTFDLELFTKDQKLYFYLNGWSEVVIEDYEFQSQHLITMNVWMHQVRKQAVRKPVIYLYSEEELTASVQINPVGQFTFTYPEYKESWNISVKGNKITDHSSGKVYPYLFWEAEDEKLFYSFNQDKMQGFIIKTDTSIAFLEHQLKTLGLNTTEQTDFITYWGPILERQPYALIQFYVDEDYNSNIAEMNVNPAPDAVRRVYMLCSGLKDPNLGMEITAQKFSSFERKGFTVVEWGGSEINLDIIKP